MKRDNEFLGAFYLRGRRCRFLVWAPRAESVEVDLQDRRIPLQGGEGGGEAGGR